MQGFRRRDRSLARLSEADLEPFVEIAFTEFGLGRTMFGGDWPVMLGTITPQRWIAFLDALLASTGETERRRFWRDNAIAPYRIGPWI